jgi:hypothetical protein
MGVDQNRAAIYINKNADAGHLLLRTARTQGRVQLLRMADHHVVLGTTCDNFTRSATTILVSQ